MRSLRTLGTALLAALSLTAPAPAVARPDAGVAAPDRGHPSPRLAKRLTDLPNYVVYAAKLGPVKQGLKTKDGRPFDACGLWVVTKNYYQSQDGHGRGVFLLANKDTGKFEEVNQVDVNQHGNVDVGHVPAGKWEAAKAAALALRFAKPKLYGRPWCRARAREALAAMAKAGLTRKPGQGRAYGINHKIWE